VCSLTKTLKLLRLAQAQNFSSTLVSYSHSQSSQTPKNLLQEAQVGEEEVGPEGAEELPGEEGDSNLGVLVPEDVDK